MSIMKERLERLSINSFRFIFVLKSWAIFWQDGSTYVRNHDKPPHQNGDCLPYSQAERYKPSEEEINAQHTPATLPRAPPSENTPSARRKYLRKIPGGMRRGSRRGNGATAVKSGDRSGTVLNRGDKVLGGRGTLSVGTALAFGGASLLVGVGERGKLTLRKLEVHRSFMGSSHGVSEQSGVVIVGTTVQERVGVCLDLL